METVNFWYRKSLIRRRLAISVMLAALGFVCLIVFGVTASFSTALFATVSALYTYKLVRDTRLLNRTTPAITINDDGIADAHLGDRLIPWETLSKIKVTGPMKTFGGMVILIANASKLSSIPGPLTVRFSNWMRGATAGSDGKQVALPMTVTTALDTTLEDLVAAIAARSPVPVERVGNAKT